MLSQNIGELWILQRNNFTTSSSLWDYITKESLFSFNSCKNKSHSTIFKQWLLIVFHKSHFTFFGMVTGFRHSTRKQHKVFLCQIFRCVINITTELHPKPHISILRAHDARFMETTDVHYIDLNEWERERANEFIDYLLEKRKGCAQSRKWGENSSFKMQTKITTSKTLT